MSRNVIMLPPAVTPNGRSIVLTHRKKRNGWQEVMYNSHEITNMLKECEKVVYLGKCQEDGDMFAVYYRGYIRIYKGVLNNGTY